MLTKVEPFVPDHPRLRIRRTGSAIELAVCIQDVWTPVRNLTLSGLSATCYLGLAVCSHNNDAITTARFRNVEFDLIP